MDTTTHLIIARTRFNIRKITKYRKNNEAIYKTKKNIEESLHGANADIDEVNKIVKQPYKPTNKYKSQDYKKTYKHSHCKEKTCTQCSV